MRIDHSNPESKYALRSTVEMRAESRRENDRQITEVRIADARWLNLDSGDVIEESLPDQTLLSVIEALRREVKRLTE
jgi:metallo-beta-lactamase family protein